MGMTDIAYWLGFASGVLATLTVITAVTAAAFVVVKLIERKRR